MEMINLSAEVNGSMLEELTALREGCKQLQTHNHHLQNQVAQLKDGNAFYIKENAALAERLKDTTAELVALAGGFEAHAYTETGEYGLENGSCYTCQKGDPIKLAERLKACQESNAELLVCGAPNCGPYRELKERLKVYEETYVHQDVLLDAQDKLKACEASEKGMVTLIENQGNALVEQDDKISQLTADLASARAEVERLHKCSYMGPMRDCPTHGESEQLKRLKVALEPFAEAARRMPDDTPDVHITVCWPDSIVSVSDFKAAQAALKETT